MGTDMHSAQARIAVVIVTFNSGDVLSGCLRALTRQRDVHLSAVVVADNASADNSVAIAEGTNDLPIRTVQGPQRGIRCRNQRRLGAARPPQT